MKHREVVPDGARCDQTVDSRPGRDSSSSGETVKPHRLFESFGAEGRVHAGERPHALLGDSKRAFIPEALKNLLDDREAGHNFVEAAEVSEVKSSGLPEDLDPDGSVNEKHAPANSCPGWRPHASRKARPPRARIQRGRESSRLWPVSQTPKGLDRPWRNRSVQPTAEAPH